MLPRILAIETSTDACSVSLSTNTQQFHSLVVEPQAHAKLVLGMIDDLCQQAGIAVKDIDALAFGRGPGSFTGVRIAASVVQGLALGLNKPVIAISSLQALAQQAVQLQNSEKILAMIDARMHEVYFGIYTVTYNGLVVSTAPDSLEKPELLNFAGVPYLTIGTGAKAYAQILLQNNPQLQIDSSIQYPRAQEVLQLAIQKFIDGEILVNDAAVPTYIRNDVAQKSKKNPD